jgi:hypothetical protein
MWTGSLVEQISGLAVFGRSSNNEPQDLAVNMIEDGDNQPADLAHATVASIQ